MTYLKMLLILIMIFERFNEKNDKNYNSEEYISELDKNLTRN